MKIGIVDVGANTARLLVARHRVGRVVRVLETRSTIALGAEIERSGKVSARKLRHVADAVGDAVVAARRAGAAEVVGLVTSPGRQSGNGGALAAAIEEAAGIRVRLLSFEEEARLAYLGARSSIDTDATDVLVCDVGGGSVQLAAGHARHEPAWVVGADIGSLRLTRRHVRHDPPRRSELRAVRRTAERALAHVSAPPTQRVLVTGGTARALRKLVGPVVGRRELETAAEIVTRRSARKVARTYGIPPWRAEVLPAGVIVVAVVHDLLGQKLEVASGGIREGAALELFERRLRAA